MATLMLVLASVVQGQTSEEQRALDLFEQAERAYEAGEVEHAVELLLEARSLRREPVLLYNLARAYETLGRLDEALEAYERYLEEEPEVDDRGAIETRIVALREQLAERERLDRERRQAEERAALEQRSPSPVPWILLGSGAAVLIGGIVFGVLSEGERDDAVDDPIHESASASLDRAESFALTANVLFVAGGVLALSGAIWGIVDLVTLPDDDLALSIGPGRLELRARW